MYGYTQQSNIYTVVEVNGCHFYVQDSPSPVSWADVQPEPQPEFENTDVFSGMGSWNSHEINNQYNDYHQQIYSPGAGSMYSSDSDQGSWNSVYSMSSGYSSGESSPMPMHMQMEQYMEYRSEYCPSPPAEKVSLKNIKNLSPVEIRQHLESWTLTAEQRRYAGYPEMTQSGQVTIVPTIWERQSKVWIDDNEKIRKCTRCSQTFEVKENGNFPIGFKICRYEVKGERLTANNHLTNQRFTSELRKFIATPSPTGPNDYRGRQAYAIDAEMVMTTAGPALARLSVVGFDGKCALDIIVKPEAKVVDYLTKYSGLTMGMMERASHTLESCRDLLLEFVNADTILIGHGLESDLKALRLVHTNVIDTSIMYQDEGKNKVALRVLANQFLDRTIQVDNPSTFGHCSEEDALASLDLVKYYLNYC